MEMVARTLRFSREHPFIFVPLLLHWMLQAVPEAAARHVSGTACLCLELFASLVRLVFPLFLAVTAAAILEGLDRHQFKIRRILRRTYDLSLRILLPLIALPLIVQAAWQMSSWKGLAFFFSILTLFAFLPEAMAQEDSVEHALERAMMMLPEHPAESMLATASVGFLLLVSYATGVWNLEPAENYDIHLAGLSSAGMVPVVALGVALMLIRSLMYRDLRSQIPVESPAEW